MENNILIIILSISSVMGMLIGMSFNGKSHKIISICLGLSFLLTWIKNINSINTAFILFGIAGILTTIYGIKTSELSKLERGGIVMMGLSIVISFIFKVQHWPGSNAIKLMLVIPCIFYLSALLQKRRFLLKEMSFMLTWLLYSLNEFSKIFIWTLHIL